MSEERLDAMAAFVRVVEAGGFSAAARELGQSKSAISKRIARLEERLGLRLLNRTTRRLSLTEAGRAYYEGCRRVVAEAETAERAMAHLAGSVRGTLRVNAPMSFGVLHVAPVLADFMRRHPELSVELVLDDRKVDLVEQAFDVGVRIGALADSSLIARRLAPSRRLLCAAPAYLSEHGVPEMPEDLAHRDCLIYSHGAEDTHWRFRGPRGLRRVRVGGRLKANNGDALREAALSGMGVGFLPSFIVGEDVGAGRLVQLLDGWSDAEEQVVHAVYPAARNLSPKVRVFVDFLVERFGPEPYWDRAVS